MTKCPNSDPNFDKILSRWFDTSSKEYPEVRKKIYYLICITLRLFLYSLIFIYKDNPIIPYIIAILSCFAIYNLYPSFTFSTESKPQQQWWSKRFQFIISVLLFITSILLILKVKSIPSVTIPILLYISLFGGIFQSMFITFC